MSKIGYSESLRNVWERSYLHWMASHVQVDASCTSKLIVHKFDERIWPYDICASNCNLHDSEYDNTVRVAKSSLSCGSSSPRWALQLSRTFRTRQALGIFLFVILYDNWSSCFARPSCCYEVEEYNFPFTWLQTRCPIWSCCRRTARSSIMA